MFHEYLSHRDAISPDGSNSLLFVISNRQIIPPSHLNMAAPYCLHSLPRTRGESDEKLALAWPSHHPDMYPSPGLRFVMKDWSSAFRLHPYCDGYFAHSVEFSIVCKRDIAVRATTELYGAWRKTIGSVTWLHISQSGSRVLIWRDVTSSESTAEWVGRHRRRGSLKDTNVHSVEVT